MQSGSGLDSDSGLDLDSVMVPYCFCSISQSTMYALADALNDQNDAQGSRIVCFRLRMRGQKKREVSSELSRHRSPPFIGACTA